ncbi:MAG: type I-U CRISPR-associated protein Csb2 [bacterium]|nr:type I-U CRISPR-associated protein Csb2 [bacterium]
MIAIEVNFLTRRYVATAHHDRRRHEWPPDPARVFSALVATWADADAPDPGERAALEWLEAQPPPAVVASDAVNRKVVSYFVPVNDASVVAPSSYRKRAESIEELSDALTDALFESEGEITRAVRGIQTKIRRQRDVSALVAGAGSTNVKSALELLPGGRGKQERWFPSVTPAEPRVTYVWSADPAQDLASALDRLLSRVARLGHSSSLVSCRLTEDPPAPTYVPGDGLKVMRSVRRGQLVALERAHEQHKAVKPRALPFAPVRYRAVSAATDGVQCLRADTAGEWLVFEFRPGSRNFPATRAVEIATTLRKAIFRYAADPLPEGLSGHQPGGGPSTRAHVGFLALPWVGHTHADGRLMGVAIGVPDSVDGESKRALLRAMGVWEQAACPLSLTFGPNGVLEMERLIGSSALVTLRPQPWRRPSQRWVSVIPVALPTHPGRLTGGTASARGAAWRRAEQAVIDSCRHVGLPEPADVVVSLDPFVAGALPAFMFPAFRQRGSNGEPVARRLVHVAVTFDRPLEGPLALGAGRYVGLGLMRPSHIEDGGDE